MFLQIKSFLFLSPLHFAKAFQFDFEIKRIRANLQTFIIEIYPLGTKWLIPYSQYILMEKLRKQFENYSSFHTKEGQVTSSTTIQ